MNKLCAVTGKQIYYTIAAAELVIRILRSRDLRRRRNSEVRWYVCKHCNAFHITSQPYRPPAKKK